MRKRRKRKKLAREENKIFELGYVNLWNERKAKGEMLPLQNKYLPENVIFLFR